MRGCGLAEGFVSKDDGTVCSGVTFLRYWCEGWGGDATSIVTCGDVGCWLLSPRMRPSVDRVDLPFGFETTGCVKNKIFNY